MMTRIMKLFHSQKTTPLPEPDAKLALGALMVRVAKSDRDYNFEEIKLIDNLLSRINGLKPIEAAKLRATSEKIEAAAPTTEKFAHLIRESVSFEARIEAHEALWQVMLADGDPHDEEVKIVDQVREALGLSESDCENARERAIAV